jgi:predicted CXXCH cytochrome family protein
VPGVRDATRFEVERGRLYVVRYQVGNASDAPVTIRPTLEWAMASAPLDWAVVPAVNPIEGVSFYSSANVRRGEAPRSAAIPPADLRLPASADPFGTPTSGVAHTGVNPGSDLVLGAHTFTEISFTIRATADATWLATYLVRLANDRIEISGAGVARLTMRDRPPVPLSPGQQPGIDGGRPIPLYPLERPAGAAISPVQSGSTRLATAAAYTSPHTNYSLTTDTCAACHSSHRAKEGMLLVKPAPQSSLCFTCHNGTGAVSNIAAQYGDPTVPANDAGTGSYYSHPATALDNHVSDREAEFGGVSNRHSACTDCHQPHLADGGLAIQTAGGWTASGALMGASGVTVANNPTPGGAPTYALIGSSVYEYEVCFKCHSGYTELNPQTGSPSTWALDKAVELNPANPAYHPVEAPGKNTSAQMANNLSGTSPYKLWNFTVGSTVRCVNCHGDSRLGNPAAPRAAGDRLAPHAVQYKGILIENLRDVSLKGPSDAYQAADFALCYVCHAEAPYVDSSQDPRVDTSFSRHGFHTAAIASFGSPVGLTVDEDGAGRGNALCAECHFRTHSTAYPVDGQASNTRLVNFAPNVQTYQAPNGPDEDYFGKLEWNAGTSSCTLTCHGVDHKAWSY